MNRWRARRLRHGVRLGQVAAASATHVVNPESFLRFLRPWDPVSRAAYLRAVGLAEPIHIPTERSEK